MASVNESPDLAPVTAEQIRMRLQALPSPQQMLEEIFLRAPVGLQLCERSGLCVLVNPMHTQLFGAVPPPDYNIFEDTVLRERGVDGLVRRAFAGERIHIAPIWYDASELANVQVERARRFAVGAELVPLRADGREVTHVLFVFHDVTQAQLAREVAEEAAQRSNFLAEAGRILSSSLDYGETLSRLARLATPTLADFCIVDVLEADGSLRRVAASHADAGRQALLDQIAAEYPPAPGSPQPAMRVLLSGQPELLEVVDARVIAQHARDGRHAQLMQELGVRSHLAVPLRHGERIVGVISLGYTGERRYSQGDLGLVEALAGRAAVAIDNARLFREAESAGRAAADANRAKDEFLAVLGHELRNPMAPIVTAMEILRRKHGDSRELEVLGRQVKHLRRLVDDLLDVSRITRGKVELDLHEVALADVARQALELAEPLLRERGHQLEVVDPGAPVVVRGDTGRLVQVVTNLLTNAARYTEPGGHVRVDWQPSGRDALLRVSDNGIGLPADALTRIFEPFVQGRQPFDRPQGGLGLGLAVVKSLVQAHGGRVEARSEGPGRGSVFEVRLPLA